MTPPTPAMTAQEALAPLIEAANRLAYVDFHTTPPTSKAPYPTFVADLRRVLPLALSALSDAERRATEAEAERDRYRDNYKLAQQNRRAENHALQSRLSAVEARCGSMRELLQRVVIYTVEDDQRVWLRIGGYTAFARHDSEKMPLLQFDAAQQSILAYPGGKSEEPVVVERDALQAMWDALDEACPHVASALRAAHQSAVLPPLPGGKSDQGEKEKV